MTNINYISKDKKIFDKYCKGSKYYPSVLPARKDNEDIIVIGDLHGDYNLTIKVMKIAKVIDNNNNWIGGNTYVVQVGDQVDNFRPLDANDPNINNSSYSGSLPEDIKVLYFMNELDGKARKYGGAVISLLGNHEIMNVLGHMNYVSNQDIEKFKDYKDPDTGETFESPKAARLHAFKQGNEYAKLLACTRLPAIIIGSYIFVHAGFVNQFMEELNIKNKNDLFKISYILRKWLLGLINTDNVIDIINSKPYSLFWDRILGAIPPNLNNDDPICVKELDKVLEIFDVKSMIIGHTPQCFANKNGINKTCGGRLWRVDFGGSFGFDKFDDNISDYRNAQVLRIRGDNGVPEILKK
jgi:hypothetical protein